MTTVRAQCWLWLILIGGFASSTLLVRSAGTPVVIFFDGGNAFVQSQTAPRQITVGAIAAQSPEQQYNTHRMRLEISNTATVDPTSTTLPPVKIGANAPYWDLFDWSVEICPGGICPRDNTLSTSPLAPSNDDCYDEEDNLGLIPDFGSLHPGLPIAPGWSDKLDSELVLRAGKLSGEHAVNCFEIKGPHGDSRVRNVAAGRKEIKWSLEASQNPYAFVDLMFYPKHGVGTPRRARLKAAVNGIELHLGTLMLGYPRVNNGDEIPHFQQFYSLFDERVLPLSEHYKMYAKRISPGVSPGTECPPAMLIAP